MMRKKIKWGVIGSGGIARRRTIPEGIIPSDYAELKAVYGVPSELNNEVAEEFNARAVSSLKELIHSDIDAAYIATPVNLHLEQVMACANAGIHILCEKPLGLSVKEARQIVEICKSKNVILGTGFMMRFQAQHQSALKHINNGDLGEPVYGRAQLSCWYPPDKGAWRQNPVTGGGGALVDLGSHCIDLLEMFFGKVTKVSCWIHNRIHDYPSEDSAVATLQFSDGSSATVDVFFCIPDNSSKNMLELYGSRGSILAKGTLGQSDSGEMTACLEKEDAGYNAGQLRGESEGRSVDPIPVNTYRAEIDDFCKAIIENREPANTGMAGLRNQILITACYESARLQKVIDIPPHVSLDSLKTFGKN